MTSPNAEAISEKFKKFEEDRQSYSPTIFCVKCGSTKIEQNAIHKLECMECRNAILWNGYKFAVARPDYLQHDAVHSLEVSELLEDRTYRDWHFSIIKALWEFSQIVNDTVQRSSATDPNYGKEGEDYYAIVDAWDQCKSRIDESLSRTP